MSSNQQRGTGAARGSVPALVLGCVPAFMASLDILVVTVALATIRHDLHASVQQLAWMVNADVLTFAMLMPLAAALGDRLGRRRMFTVGLTVFTAASAACALAPSADVLIAARAVQGAGAALLTPLSLALVAAAFPAGRRGKAMGIWSAVTGLAVALGPLVGGVIIEGVSWPWIFWVNVPIGVVAILFTNKVFHESRGPRRALDLPGVVLASGGLLALVSGIVRGNGGGWTSAATVTAIGTGAGLLVAFVTWQLHGPSPMLPRHLLTSRASLTANGASFMLTASLFGAAFLVPLYLQGALHSSVLVTGVRMLPWTAVTMFVTPLAGRLADRIGNRALMVAGLLLQGVAFAWLAALVTPSAGYGSLVPPLLMAGIGVALVFPAMANAAVGGVAAEELGMASATNTSFRSVGATIGVAVAGALFERAGGFGGAAAITAGVVPGLAVAAVISLAGAMLALGVRGRPRQLAATLTPAHALADS